MGQVLHGCARTTEAVRVAIQGSEGSVRALAARYGVSPTTIQKWRKRDHVHDAAMGPKQVRSSTLTLEQEAAVVAFRRNTLLPLDDCLYALQPSLPHLTRSSLPLPTASCLSGLRPLSPPARDRGRQAGQADVQNLPDRVLSPRHRRGPHRRGQALSVPRHRQNLEVCRRAPGGGSGSAERRGVPGCRDRGSAVSHPRCADRQSRSDPPEGYAAKLTGASSSAIRPATDRGLRHTSACTCSTGSATITASSTGSRSRTIGGPTVRSSG